jgi:aminopeptidase N
MLLPCWDEPARKATFTISVHVPKDKVAVSNMPIVRVTALDDRYQRVQFATSPKMSTYLLFLSIGDYERVRRAVEGTDVGIVVKRGDLPKAAYALEQAAALLHYYNTYFGIQYPLPKLDLIAAPGEITGGSMENWGAIFYSHNHLLFDPRNRRRRTARASFWSLATKWRISGLGISSPWYGGTIFGSTRASLAGCKLMLRMRCIRSGGPGFRRQRSSRAASADAQSSSHPVLQPINSAEQAAQAFDHITYDKGAAVITMLEADIGPDTFRKGVDRYMHAHAYGNTVDSDLWGQMQPVAAKPILDIERDFTRRRTQSPSFPKKVYQ